MFTAHIWAVPCQGQTCIAMRESDHARRVDSNLVPEQRQIIERVAPRGRKLASSVMDACCPLIWHKSCLTRPWRVEMATTTLTSAIRPTASGLATADEIRAAFTEHREELAWLAGFLSADEMVAAACIIDARKLAQNEGIVVQEWLWTSARDATIRSALDVQRVRIAQLSSAYDRRASTHVPHPALPLDMDTLEFLVRESDQIRLRLDSICRFVLVLCGTENRSSQQVARLLGIGEHAVEAAYCAALQSLDVIRSQAIVEAYGYAAAYN